MATHMLQKICWNLNKGFFKKKKETQNQGEYDDMQHVQPILCDNN